MGSDASGEKRATTVRVDLVGQIWRKPTSQILLGLASLLPLDDFAVQPSASRWRCSPSRRWPLISFVGRSAPCSQQAGVNAILRGLLVIAERCEAPAGSSTGRAAVRTSGSARAADGKAYMTTPPSPPHHICGTASDTRDVALAGWAGNVRLKLCRRSLANVAVLPSNFIPDRCSLGKFAQDTTLLTGVSFVKARVV